MTSRKEQPPGTTNKQVVGPTWECFVLTSTQLTRSQPIGADMQNVVPLNMKIAADILRVIDGDLRQTVAGFFLFYASYILSVIFCSLPEVASEVIYGQATNDVHLDVCVNMALLWQTVLEIFPRSTSRLPTPFRFSMCRKL